MLKCFHISATPMEQIYHVASCEEASKGEIMCWTCQKCHEFKKWHTKCNTLVKSPVELLRRLSNRKRGSNNSAGEPSATKRGRTAVNDDFEITSGQENHEVECMWLPEMEDPTSLLLHEDTSNPSAALELDAEVNNIPLAMQPKIFQTARPLLTPPATRTPSWSENSQNLVAYGDVKDATHVPEQPPPYIVSPQTTVDECQLHNTTDTLRLGIPPAQYIQESSFMESPEEMEPPEAPWADHAVFHETQDQQMNMHLPSTVQNATGFSQYGTASEKTASMFSRSFPASRIPNPSIQKQNTWPPQLDPQDDSPRPPPSEDQPHQTLFGVLDVTGQYITPSTATQQDTRAKLLIGRQASFENGVQDSITVSTVDQDIQTGANGPEEDSHEALPSRRRAREHQTAVQEYEECGRCGQRFQGMPKNRKQHLKRHVASKHGDVRFRCGHQGCRRSYNRVDNLHDHERKCHRLAVHQQFEEPAELPAGDVEILEGVGSVVEDNSSAVGAAHHQDSNALETHLAVYGYPMPTEEGHGWRHCAVGDARDLDARRTAGLLTDEEWDALMAGVSGGQHEDEEAGPPDVGHDELAPRPLELPCTSWRVLGD